MPFNFSDPAFWLDLGQIMMVNIVLSGDNAVVIALAARSLPSEERKRAIVLGSVAAILMRISLTFAALQLLTLPFLKLFGSLMLLWIASKLLAPEESSGNNVSSHNTLASAVRTILIADLVMSLDNVLAVAAAAGGNQLMLIIGLGISIPIVIFGSSLILRLMDRYPIIIDLGAAILGFVAGEMLVTEPALAGVDIFSEGAMTHQILPYAFAGLVLLIGKLKARALGEKQAVLVDLAQAKRKSKSGPKKQKSKSKAR